MAKYRCWEIEDSVLFSNLKQSATGMVFLKTREGEKQIGVGDYIVINDDGSFDKVSPKEFEIINKKNNL